MGLCFRMLLLCWDDYIGLLLLNCRSWLVLNKTLPLEILFEVTSQVLQNGLKLGGVF